MSKRITDLTAAELDALARDAWAHEAEESLRQGLPVTYVEDGKVYRLWPDGRRECIASEDAVGDETTRAGWLFDATKYMKDFDPTKMVGAMRKALKQYHLPGVNVEAVVESQRKNLEALTAANRVAFEGLQAVAKRQAEILAETMNEASKAVDSWAKAGSPPEMATKQLEIAKQAFDRGLANMRELAEELRVLAETGAKSSEAAPRGRRERDTVHLPDD